MKRFIIIAVIFFSFFSLYSNSEGKLKLAIMEFEDKSKTLGQKTLLNAAEYLRSGFVGSDQFIIIAKERQEKTLIKEMKKESYQMCNDRNCQIPLGQALSADSILRTTINYFGGVYNITAELIDLAKEATVKGAKFQFDGTEKGLMHAMDRVIIQIAGKTVSFDPGKLKSEDSKGVELGGINLETLPTVNVSIGKFDKVLSTPTIRKFESVPITDEDIQIDVLEAYDKAVEADKNGNINPQLAALRWKELAELKHSNPYYEKAKKRHEEWNRHIIMKELGKFFEIAKSLDIYGKLFPERVISSWEFLVKTPNENPYYDIAVQRINNWKKFSSQIAQYREQRKAFEEQRLADKNKLVRALPLKVLSNSQKRTMLIKYIELYAPFYGVDDIDGVFSTIGREKSKSYIELLYNEYLYTEMKEKCNKGQINNCYIYASLTEVENPEQSLQNFERSCSQGVVDGCIKAGKSHYDKANFEKAFSHFSDACSWDSHEGCHITGFLVETGIGTERNKHVAEMLYQKSCESGYEISCRMKKNIAEHGYSSDQARNLVEKEKFDKKISDAVGSEGEDLVREVRPKAKFDDTTMTVKKMERYFPYKWAGISISLIGLGIAVGGAVGFNAAATHQFNIYKQKTTDENLGEAIMSGISKENYISSVNKYRDKGNLYKTLSIVSGAVGGALVVGGVIMAVIPKEKEVMKKISFITDGRGFYAGLTFNF